MRRWCCDGDGDGDGDGDVEDSSGENDDLEFVRGSGVKTLVIETLNKQPGHVRDVRVVMNHVRVVCPILLERDQNYNYVIFCFKSPLHQHQHHCCHAFYRLSCSLYVGVSPLRKVMKCYIHKSDNNRYVFTLMWGREKLLNSPD